MTSESAKRRSPFSCQPAFEQRLWARLTGEWLPVVVILAATALGIVGRFAFRHMKSDDYLVFLSSWFDEIKQGGLASLGHQVGDYNVAYQALIYVMTLLPIPKLYAYKSLSCLFDVVLAGASGLLVRKLVLDGRGQGEASSSDSNLMGAVCYALVLMSPTVMLNSAAWAQCDSIYAALCMLSILALVYDCNLPALVFLGLAFCFKLQAVFLLPLFLYACVADHRFSIAGLFAIPLVMLLVGLVFVPLGRGVCDTFAIYASQTGEYPSMWLLFPSFWAVAFPAADISSEVYKMGGGTLATATTCGALLVEAAVLARKRVKVTGLGGVRIGLLFSLTAVVLLPSMHERYAYLVDVLAIIVALLDCKMIFPAFVLNVTSLMTYCAFLWHVPVTPHIRLVAVAYSFVALYAIVRQVGEAAS